MGATSSSPPTMRESGLGSLLVFGTLVLGAVAGSLVALSVSGLSPFVGQGLSVADGDMVGVALNPDFESRPKLGALVESTTTSTTSPSTTSVTVAASPAQSTVELWALDESDQSSRLAALSRNGVFSYRSGAHRLASFVVVDDLVVTSAAVVDERSDVWLRVDGQWTPADVVALDPYTDVAVLLPAEPLPADGAPEAAVGPAPDLGAAIRVQILPGHDDGQMAIEELGFVGQAEELVTTALHRYCYDAFITSLPSSSPPGSAVVDEFGAVVGMTISAMGPLTAAVPIATVQEVARSMVESGSPSDSWLGVKAADDDGRTRLTEVLPLGPSADSLRPEDVILSVNGEAVENPDHLVHLVRQVDLDVDVELLIERGGSTKPVTIVAAQVAKSQ